MADRGRVGSLVVGCKSAAQKEWRRTHEGHRARIQQVKSVSDLAPPASMGMDHFRVNLKKERLLEDRYMEIDRENGILMKKMSQAMKKPNTYTDKPDANKPASMNKQARKHDLIRITQENQRMLKAIHSTKPVYDTKRWEESYRKSEALVRNCSTYPVITRLPRDKSAPSIMMSLSPDEDGNQSVAASRPNSSFVSGEEGKQVCLKEGMRIGEKYWLLEMTTDGQALNVSAYDGEAQTLEMMIKEKKHRQLYRELNGDYSSIAGRLRIEGNRLLLD